MEVLLSGETNTKPEDVSSPMRKKKNHYSIHDTKDLINLLLGSQLVTSWQCVTLWLQHWSLMSASFVLSSSVIERNLGEVSTYQNA